FEWAVKLNRFSLHWIGLWPVTKPRKEKLKCHLRALFLSLFILIMCTVPSLHSLLKIRTNIMLLIDNLQFTLPILASIFKLAVFWWKTKGMIDVLKMMEQDWATSRIKKERNIMIEKAQITRLIVTCAFVIIFVCATFAIILPVFGISMRGLSNITDPGKLLPLPSYYVYDVTKSPQYELTYISQSVSMCMAIMPYTGIDNFLGLLVLHICGQLDILKSRLENLNRFDNFQNVLKTCIMDHTRLLRAINIIDDAFNLILLMLLLYFGILFALYGFLGVTLLEGQSLSITRLIFLVILVINAFAHIGLYCAVGEILAARCDKIHFATYNHEWYNLDPKDTKNLILLMIRSNKPFYLTAGKIFPMSMSTFCNLLKTSAGYVSVLLATRNQ
ncbi:OrU20, partial [Eciton burchellii]